MSTSQLPPEVAANTGMLSVMGTDGDSRIMWNRDNRDEVEAARAHFNKLRDKGYIAWTVKGDSNKGNQIHEFDANLERIIMSPRVVGG